MKNSIASKLIKEDNIGTSSAGVDLDEFVSGGGDLLSSNSLEGCASWGNVLALDAGSRDDMPQQHGLQLLLVLQQAVQCINWDLIKSCVCWSKDCERSGTLEGFHQTSSLDSSEEGGELWVGGNNVGHGLGGVLDDGRVGGQGVLRIGSVSVDTEVAVDGLDRVDSVGLDRCAVDHVDRM